MNNIFITLFLVFFLAGCTTYKVDKKVAHLKTATNEHHNLGDLLYTTESELYPNFPVAENAKGNPNGIYPMYPTAAIKDGICGQVKLLVLISEIGDVEDSKIVSAQPQGYFEEASLSAVKKWSFQPLIINGAATRYQAIIPVNFRLKELYQCNPNKSFQADK